MDLDVLFAKETNQPGGVAPVKVINANGPAVLFWCGNHKSWFQEDQTFFYGPNLSIGQWHHVSLSFDVTAASATLRTSLDGMSAWANQSLPTSWNGLKTVTIGGRGSLFCRDRCRGSLRRRRRHHVEVTMAGGASRAGARAPWPKTHWNRRPG